MQLKHFELNIFCLFKIYRADIVEDKNKNKSLLAHNLFLKNVKTI